MTKEQYRGEAFTWLNETIRGIKQADRLERASALYARLSGFVHGLAMVEIISPDEREYYVEKGLVAVQENAERIG